MKKNLLLISGSFITIEAFADQPKDWQLGFQNPASDPMRHNENNHNNHKLPNKKPNRENLKKKILYA